MKLYVAVAAVVLVGLSPVSGQLIAAHAPSKAAQAQAVAAQQQLEKPVAKVNGTVLTQRDLLREMYVLFPYARQHNGGFPKEMEGDIRAGALKMIEFEELVYQDALRRKMTIAPAQMAKAEREFKAQFHSPEQYDAFLKSEMNGSEKVLREKIRRSLLIEKMLKLEVTDKATVTLADAKAFYDKNPDKFKEPESFSIQTISFMTPGTATPAQVKQVRERAENALKQAKATKTYKDFGLLAEKVSEDDFRVMMGDHKAVTLAQLPPQVAQALGHMKAGEVSDLIQLGQDYTIVRLNSHNPAGMAKFDDIKVKLQDYLEKQKTEQLRSTLNKQLRQTAKIQEM